MAHFIYNAYGGDGLTTTLSRFLLVIIRRSSGSTILRTAPSHAGRIRKDELPGRRLDHSRAMVGNGVRNGVRTGTMTDYPCEDRLIAPYGLSASGMTIVVRQCYGAAARSRHHHSGRSFVRSGPK